ncbi:hypothetical protein GGR56DRAFT_518224 [Xylariaceae sp. FL0804]|nr:hypothetical protein GGR56DRAFT_518224 [Xylariaceae sp. FL0804]
MMGNHNRTRTKTYTRTEVFTEYSDDDYHVTVRFGKDENTCNISGHIYIYTERRKLEGKPVRYTYEPIRVMEEHERSYVGGRPCHYWIWGPYDRRLPRNGPVLPRPPFVKKEGREIGKAFKGKGGK